MLTIVLYACLMASDNCTITALAGGFVTAEQCQQLGARFIVPAWVVLNPDKELRRWICTPSPEYLLNRGKA